MARNAKIKSDEHAARILEVVYGDDDEALAPVDDQMVARLRTAVDAAFDRAWADVRARSRAEVEARRAGPKRRLDTWTRPELLAHLAALQSEHATRLQVAHRKLETMSDDDLRSLIDDLESALDREDAP